jgi:hypothetical protein
LVAVTVGLAVGVKVVVGVAVIVTVFVSVGLSEAVAVGVGGAAITKVLETTAEVRPPRSSAWTNRVYMPGESA